MRHEMVRSSRVLFWGCVCRGWKGKGILYTYSTISTSIRKTELRLSENRVKLKKSYNSVTLRLFHIWLLFNVVALCLSTVDVEWLNLLLAWLQAALRATSYWCITLLSFSPVVVAFAEAEGNSCWFLFLVSCSLTPLLFSNSSTFVVMNWAPSRL